MINILDPRIAKTNLIALNGLDQKREGDVLILPAVNGEPFVLIVESYKEAADLLLRYGDTNGTLGQRRFVVSGDELYDGPITEGPELYLANDFCPSTPEALHAKGYKEIYIRALTDAVPYHVPSLEDPTIWRPVRTYENRGVVIYSPKFGKALIDTTPRTKAPFTRPRPFKVAAFV